jgi:tetratricopeptide (TPR) repeat protein
MWYLIVPPIVVVLSLAFVLWYLSRQGADPFVARKISQLEGTAEQKVSFPRTKNFFLRMLEKTAYRFKVVSLQMHNALNDLTQALKERRKLFQEKTKKQEGMESKKEEQVVAEERTSSAVSDKLSFFRSPSVESSQKIETEKTEDTMRPMVSDYMTRPEVSYRKTSADIVREEGLIARIAVNPKDFVAYEELGDHYLEIGNVKDAKECYRQVLRLSPVQRMVKIKIRRLEKILLQKEQ